ncbi:MAG TPA: preprotein translocase subunit YajC [Acidimicrobiales bacterium]|nr:preprotein translocase subunit YajC [Acidimicrobiales bacterium]
MSLVIFLVLLVAMYAVLIVPQQRRVKAQRAILNSLTEGDVVLTSAGIYGVITEMVDNDVYLEVAEGIELKITKASIAGKVRGDDATDTPAVTPETDTKSDTESSSGPPSIARGWRKGR